MAQWIQQAASTVVTAGGQLAAGQAAQMGAEHEAKQLEQQGKEEYASSTREAQERRREADLLISAARARGAGSGADASDVGMIERVGEIESAGDYNVLASLFEGKVKKQSLFNQAAASRWGGKVAYKAGRTQALGTAIKGGGKSYGSYSGGGGG